MAFPTYKSIENLSLEELDIQILKIKKELLYFRIQKATFSPVAPHLIKKTKHQLAQLLTLKNEKYKNFYNTK